MNRTFKFGAVALTALSAFMLARCSEDPVPPPNVEGPVNRCEADLTPFLSKVGSGASARRIESADQLIGGEAAQGRIGDLMLENDKIRVIIQGPDRHIQPNPYGGQIIDADIRRDGPGRDAFGKIAPLYAFGRTQKATSVDVYRDRDGRAGGAAVVVADGVDAVNDFININSMIGNMIPGVSLAIDPSADLPLKISTYYILNPGETRVRMVTALCNVGGQPITIPVGDLIDSGGDLEFFNPQSCTKGFGYAGCLVDNMSWYGFQGDGVAYGYAPQDPNVPGKASVNNGALVVSGVAGTLLGAAETRPAIDGLLAWTDESARTRDGQIRIPANEGKLLVRDFVVGRDLGAVASAIFAYRSESLGTALGQIKGRVLDQDSPIAGARVAIERDVPTPYGGTERIIETVFTTDVNGFYEGTLPAGDYQISAWAKGRKPSELVSVSIPSSGVAERDFTLGTPRKLTVSITDLDGAPSPGKVTILCEQHPCEVRNSRLVKYYDSVRDALPDNVALMAYVGPTGTAEFLLPPGNYRAVVTRGPEWSVWPNTWAPLNSTDASTGAPLDLTSGDGKIEATLARVLDTPGWMSADFHVHAINSPDAYVPNTARVVSYLGEGVDILVATDHDFVTDLSPYVRELKAEKLIATVVGSEITTFDYGHTNVFPLVADLDDFTGGAFDWAGGDGPGFAPPVIFEKAREMGAKTVQINHPRGALGVFSATRLDTDTLATRAPPEPFRITPIDGATELDTRLFGPNFNALEIFNGSDDHPDRDNAKALLNDWFTFLSRGVLVAGTGVSDTHQLYANSPGYWRSYVDVGSDATDTLDPHVLSASVNALKVVATNGPFVTLRAYKVDGDGQQVGEAVGVGGTLASDGGEVELEVDAQIPAWMSLSKIEIYTHIPGGDGPCPDAMDFKKYPNSRVACDGQGNTNWPAEGIAASADLVEADFELVKAAEKDGVVYNRKRVVKKFRLPEAPSSDTWYVASVRGESTTFPLFYAGLDSNSKRANDGRPAAFTNPVFIDVDGGGYDNFPARAYQPTGAKSFAAPQPQPMPKKPEPARRPMTFELFRKLWELVEADH